MVDDFVTPLSRSLNLTPCFLELCSVVSVLWHVLSMLKHPGTALYVEIILDNVVISVKDLVDNVGEINTHKIIKHQHIFISLATVQIHNTTDTTNNANTKTCSKDWQHGHKEKLCSSIDHRDYWRFWGEWKMMRIQLLLLTFLILKVLEATQLKCIFVL